MEVNIESLPELVMTWPTHGKVSKLIIKIKTVLSANKYWYTYNMESNSNVLLTDVIFIEKII